MATFQVPLNSTLEEFVDFFFKDRYASPNDYKVIGTSNATLAGLNGKQFTMYDYDKDPTGGPGSTSKAMRILAVDNSSNGYAVKYGADPGAYDKYLPIAQKITESLQINQNISETPTPVISNTSTTSRQSPFLTG